MDFNSFRDLASQSEAEALRRQEQNVQDQTGAADAYLLRASQERTPGQTDAQLSQTGSYGDYLKAKQGAENARAAMALNGGGIYGDVRNSIDKSQGYSQGADDALTRLQGREDMQGYRYAQGTQDRQRADEVRSAWEAKQAADQSQRQFNDTQNRQHFNADLDRRMRSQWSTQDTRHLASGGAGMFNPFKDGSQGFGGQFNPYGFNRGPNDFSGNTGPNPDEQAMMGKDAYWGLEDNQRLAQMARAQGMNSEADKYQSTATYDAAGKRTSGGY